MSRHYHVIGLTPEHEFRNTGSGLEVDLTCALQRASVHNDSDLLKLQGQGEYLWVAGGGTYLLNQRYLLTIQRPIDARVNPGKFSLFTGRADCSEELLQPGLLIRELFEELLLYSGVRLCKPICEEFQGTIDRVYTQLSVELGLSLDDAVPFPLQAIGLPAKAVTVTNDGESQRYALNFHVSPNKDVNVLFLLAGQADLSSLSAQDGEYHIESGIVVRHARNIYLYDMETSLGQNISARGRNTDPVEIPLDSMSSHMRYLVESVAGLLAASGSDNRLQANTN